MAAANEAVCPALTRNKTRNKNKKATRFPQGIHMVRMAWDGLALASVASFVWMMLAVVQHVG
ncbi:cell division inhibitor SidA [Phenylobacterium montanum]|uniref:Cell division inhibitor SidA n=1 Tax=Phenylobacterium montanum TaxID=2823693 RepID=A0A975G292_9CAUL|nr:cell division inhibitor SidA [Caulobacter sp. S6]QUD88676.1 cell division inhibitor SidA [Caulobacter sp. S6]